MATRIEVNVDQGGLLQRNRQQTTANRQAKAEGDSRTRAVSAAKTQRQQRLAAENRTPDNASRPSSALLPFSEQRPAAQRIGEPLKLGHLWLFEDETKYTSLPSLTLFTSGEARFIDDNFYPAKPIHIGCGDGSTWVDLTAGVVNGVEPNPYNLISVCNYNSFGTDRNVGITTLSRVYTQSSLTRYLILPAGAENFVLVYNWDSMVYIYTDTGYYESRNGDTSSLYATQNICGTTASNYGLISAEMTPVHTRTRKVFVCNNNSIREVPMPGVLDLVLDAAVFKPPITSTTSISTQRYLDGLFAYPTGSISYLNYAFPTSSVADYSSNRFANVLGTQVFDAGVYGAIQSAYPFVLSDQIRETSSVRGALVDNRTGAYRFYDNDGFPLDSFEYPHLQKLYNDESEFLYGVMRNKTTTPFIGAWQPDPASPVSLATKKSSATLTLDPERIQRLGTTYIPFPGASPQYEKEKLFIAWDSGMPQYCKNMLLALGFSESDLKP